MSIAVALGRLSLFAADANCPAGDSGRWFIAGHTTGLTMGSCPLTDVCGTRAALWTGAPTGRVSVRLPSSQRTAGTVVCCHQAGRRAARPRARDMAAIGPLSPTCGQRGAFETNARETARTVCNAVTRVQIYSVCVLFHCRLPGVKTTVNGCSCGGFGRRPIFQV